MPWRALAIVLLAAACSPARANAPAPWAVCRGQNPGDPCHSRYYPRGRCQLRQGCADGDETCLECVSGLDPSFRYDALPAALSCAGLLALVVFMRFARSGPRSSSHVRGSTSGAADDANGSRHDGA